MYKVYISINKILYYFLFTMKFNSILIIFSKIISKIHLNFIHISYTPNNITKTIESQIF